MFNGYFKFYLFINISIILGYTLIYFKIFVRHCYKQKVDLYTTNKQGDSKSDVLLCFDTKFKSFKSV